MEYRLRKILVLCVDRDNDVGERLGISTPVVGKDNLVKIATDYVLKYPDDSDANAIFGSVQLYNSLVSSMGTDNVEVALVTGSSGEDFMADLKLLSEVDKVLRIFNADAFIVVSDGPADEVVMPLLQSKKPIVSVRRIVVKQTKGLEEFAVLARYYANKLFREHKYRKYILGFPGVFVLFYGLWTLIPNEIRTVLSTIFCIIIGILLLLTALNLHNDILRFLRRYETTFFIGIVSTSLTLIYPLTSIYVLNMSIHELLINMPTLFDVIGIAVGIILVINAVEVYTKYSIKPYGRFMALIMLFLLPVLVIDPLYSFVNGKLVFIDLLKSLLAYFTVNVVSLFMIEYFKKRELRVSR